jgi:Family of unknown function (DUF5681)
MSDEERQTTGKTEALRDPRGRFRKGSSGNPAGRPKGSQNRATRAAALLLDGEAEALTKKAVALALAGDPAALRLCLDRILAPRRGRPVELPLPPLASAADLGTAMAAVAAAATEGRITPEEALSLSQMVESFTRTLEAAHVWRRRLWRGKFWKAWVARSRRAGEGAP